MIKLLFIFLPVMAFSSDNYSKMLEVNNKANHVWELGEGKNDPSGYFDPGWDTISQNLFDDHEIPEHISAYFPSPGI